MRQKLKNIYHLIIAIIAAYWHGFPSRKLIVIGVTGTDGKTTTVHLIHHILTQAGKKAAMISSVCVQITTKMSDTGLHVTTPNTWKLQKILKQIADAGQEYVVLEVTSHATDQYRIWGIDFDIAVLTNVTEEHLDYHQTYEKYIHTKFKFLQQAKIAVLNKDDKSYRWRNLLSNRMVSYGFKQADLSLDKINLKPKLPGKYNLSNCLASALATKQLGISDSDIRKAIQSFTGVKGRFEYVDTEDDFQVVVDFAHTPNALFQVLSAVKPRVTGRLIHVFGSAGLRDVLKRAVMGEISASFADMIVLTEEDYRTEDVNQIIDQIAEGCIKKAAKLLNYKNYQPTKKHDTPIFFRIPDRQRAISFAIGKLANKGDTVIITGKGHEKSLCRGKKEYSWDEYQAIKQALSNRRKII